MAGVVALLAFGWHSAHRPESGRKRFRSRPSRQMSRRHEKFDAQFTHRIFAQIHAVQPDRLAYKSAPELMIWPESSMPDPVGEPESGSYGSSRISLSTKTDLLLGTLDVESEHDYNAAALFPARQERNASCIRKCTWCRLANTFRFVIRFPFLPPSQANGSRAILTSAPITRFFVDERHAGRAADLLRGHDWRPDPAVRAHGANLLVNVTNDGWFLHSAGSRQHLANAIFRCVETRRPMVRAANTGVTCFVNEFGRVTQMLRTNRQYIHRRRAGRRSHRAYRWPDQRFMFALMGNGSLNVWRRHHRGRPGYGLSGAPLN